jgi:D-alanine-D-alanine ligase
VAGLSAADLPPLVVLAGGPSAEHDVSIVSGHAMADALADAGADVRRVVIGLDGTWWWLPGDHRRADRPASDYDEPRRLGAEGPISLGAALDRLSAADPAPVVVLGLHGPWGEDGTIQAMLDAIGVAYTGAGVTASAIGMDKAIFKRLCRGLGIPVVDWREVRASRWRSDRSGVRREMAAFAAGAEDPRLMVKPARLGSSVGMTLVHDAAQLSPALDLAFRYDSLAVVESYVPDARDLEVSVIGNDHARLEIYGPGEIVSGHEFYDYAAKYTPGLSETTTNAEVTDVERAVIHKLTRDVYRAIGAEGYARVDFLMAGERVLVSEINTLPGFTPISLFPTMPAAGGFSFGDVCVRIVQLAIERQAARPAARLGTGDLPR